MKYLNRIQGSLDYLEKSIDINLNSRNVVITGANGSGKTTLLKKLHESIKVRLTRNHQEYESHTNSLNYQQSQLVLHPIGSNEYQQIQSQIEYIKKWLNDKNPSLNLEISNINNFIINFNNFKAVNLIFEAMRINNIQAATSTTSIQIEKDNVRQNYRQHGNQIMQLGMRLEQHLLNLKFNESLAGYEEKDEIKAKKFSDWFKNFNEQLTFLFEGIDTRLKFNIDTRKFSILQNERDFTFQELSSGYQAIFNIYAELLMSSEMFDVPPNELEGIVIIDEIDVHLHISLQRIILPFFMKAFPNIQFIVSTHSPFVITSTDNTVVFDLTKNELIEEDLTNFSYDSIVKGLFHVDTTNGENLEKIIEDVNELLKFGSSNLSQLKEKVELLQNFENKLDINAKLTLLKAKNKIIDSEAEV